MNRMTKGLSALALAGLLQLGWVQISPAEVVDRIVAEVNDEIITMSELQGASKAIEAQAGLKPTGKESKNIERQMLESLIDRKLAKAEAKRRGITVDDKELAAAMDLFRKKNNLQDDDAFNKALNKAGLSIKELKQTLADQIIQQRLISVAVGAKAMVNDAEVRRFYDEHFKTGAGVTRVHLRVMQIPYPPGATEAQKEETKKKAEAILAELKQGSSFPDVAAKFSVQERDVGFVSQSDLDPRLAEFLGRMKPKEVAPALSPQGVQLFMLVDRRTGGEPRPFEEVAPEIRQMLSQKGMEKEFGEWVKTLRAKAHIKIML
ncbi:MAG: SurA N-terminal domain-containing protein [Deltaproteobacteria bacterium]|nr:SurA N-terminal domain-containing protein [Deltaproteobacteria bacterium]